MYTSQCGTAMNIRTEKSIDSYSYSAHPASLSSSPNSFMTRPEFSSKASTHQMCFLRTHHVPSTADRNREYNSKRGRYDYSQLSAVPTPCKRIGHPFTSSYPHIIRCGHVTGFMSGIDICPFWAEILRDTGISLLFSCPLSAMRMHAQTEPAASADTLKWRRHVEHSCHTAASPHIRWERKNPVACACHWDFWLFIIQRNMEKSNTLGKTDWVTI